MTNFPRSPQYAQYEAALQNQNVRAFLDAIAKAEGTYGRGDRGYNINVGHGQFNNGYVDHPRNTVQLNSRLRSNAAGRYQFMSYTWDRIARAHGFNDFKPHTQDIAAVALIAQRGALNDVINGNIQQAAHKCRQEWASLPGSTYGQRTVSTNSFMQGFRDAFAAIGRGFNTVMNTVGNAIGSAFRPAEPSSQLTLQQTPPQPTGLRINRQNEGSPQPAPAYVPPYTPPYASPSGPPRDGRQDIRPVVAHPPTHGLVNNPVHHSRAESNVIMGDSIGASLKLAYPNKQNVAVVGVSIGAAAAQFRHLRPGAVADVVLGSNNGPYPDAENKRQVQLFLQAADRAGVKINNWVLPGNNQGSTHNDVGLARVANVISETIREYNQAHRDRPPIQPIVTRDRGIQKDADGLHLTAAGTQQIRTLIANAQPSAPAPTHAAAPSHRFVIHTQLPPRGTA